MGKKIINPVEFVNTDTGEIQRGNILLPEERPNKLIGGFFMGFQEAFEVLACEDLTPSSYKVLLLLLSKLDFDNWIHLSQIEIGEKLKIAPSHISRAMAALKRKEIILIARYKGVRCMKLNPCFGWKGSVTSLNKQEKKPSHLTVVK